MLNNTEKIIKKCTIPDSAYDNYVIKVFDNGDRLIDIGRFEKDYFKYAGLKIWGSYFTGWALVAGVVGVAYLIDKARENKKNNN